MSGHKWGKTTKDAGEWAGGGSWFESWHKCEQCGVIFSAMFAGGVVRTICRLPGVKPNNVEYLTCEEIQIKRLLE